ncbi:threonine/serine dehydratase [Actinopolymorpha sp. B9G3]|uniref:threonine ammonia-lyase n=1 Tax=Actinopolymorpha sp. B9G3 TaxID=3158970 RepID=UPI0032D95E4A
MVGLEAVRAARETIGTNLLRTPVLSVSSLDGRAGVEVLVKAEVLQKTGSFKPRGVLNRLARLTPDERDRGVICISAGNHAQALAWAAARMGVSAAAVMPTTAQTSKIAATKAYGAEVILRGESAVETHADFPAIVAESGRVVIPPYDDPAIIAGQGTIGLEVLEDVPDLDAIVVPVGGGGLVGGIAAVVKEQRPSVRVIGVEPTGAACLHAALAEGHVVHLPRTPTIADGLAAPFVSERTLALATRYVDDVVQVSDEEIVEAMGILLERTKLLTEPGGAVAVAALLHRRCGLRPGQRAVAVLSGGNVDRALLTSLL